MGDFYDHEHDVSRAVPAGGVRAGGDAARRGASVEHILEGLSQGGGGWEFEGEGGAAAALAGLVRGLGLGMGDAPPPASEAAIAALQRVYVEGDGEKACVVCTEVFGDEEEVLRLPCGHVYHGECIVPWLKRHCTCPACRKEVESESAEYNERVRVAGRQKAVQSMMSSMYN